MGMYTELVLGVELKNASVLLKTLDRMVSDQTVKPEQVPDHPLFQTQRWNYMLNSNSYYFDLIPHTEIKYDSMTGSHFLTAIFSVKNYDSEIEKFCDWIAPYVVTRGMAGYKRYEEDELPKLLFFNAGRAFFVTVSCDYAMLEKYT